MGKKLFLAATILLFTLTHLHAQQGIYLATEGGFMVDNFRYVSERGHDENFFRPNSSSGIMLGGKINALSFETGYYYHKLMSPVISYDFNTDKLQICGAHGATSSFVLPFRAGYDLLYHNQSFFLKPELGILVYISEGCGEGAFGYSNGDLNTQGSSFCTSRMHVGLESSLSGGYCFQKRLEIFLKFSYHDSFRTLYYDSMVHSTENQTMEATSTFRGNSLTGYIGLRFYLRKQN